MTNFTSDSRVGRVLLLPAGLLACSLFTPFTVTARNDIPVTISQQVRTKIQVNGTVTDATGEPLIGATVLEKASGNGTITDVDGNFSLAVPSDAVLSVSYIGYKPQDIVVNGKTTFNVVLEDDSEKLEEVVVVGYGVQRKVNLSGSVDQINAKQLEARPITNISKGLQGMVPNLNIDFTSGEPGQAAKINIRGEASINGGSPLILIDGVASDAEELNRLLPEDIETLSVLKDASSAAIYGARAAFGVILITTKQGSSDRIQVSYNNNFAWKRPSILPNKTSDPYIYLKLKNIAVLPGVPATSPATNAWNGHASAPTILTGPTRYASTRSTKRSGNIWETATGHVISWIRIHSAIHISYRFPAPPKKRSSTFPAVWTMRTVSWPVS